MFASILLKSYLLNASVALTAYLFIMDLAKLALISSWVFIEEWVYTVTVFARNDKDIILSWLNPEHIAIPESEQMTFTRSDGASLPFWDKQQHVFHPVLTNRPSALSVWHKWNLCDWIITNDGWWVWKYIAVCQYFLKESVLCRCKSTVCPVATRCSFIHSIVSDVMKCERGLARNA